MTIIQTQCEPIPEFREDVRRVALQVRRVLAGAFDVVGVDPRRPIEVSRQLGLEKKLAWKVARVVTHEDPLAGISSIPGRSSQNVLIESLRKAKAPESSLSAVREALELFDDLVATHAGGRDAFDQLLAGLTRDAERDEAYRKLSFEGNGVTWGIQMRARVAAHIRFPGKHPLRPDLAIVKGFVDFRRLRADAPWPIWSHRFTNDDGSPMPMGQIEPIDPAITDPHAYPALREFCSENMPPLQMTGQGDGKLRFDIAEGAVGLRGEFSCFGGFMKHNTAEMPGPPQKMSMHIVDIDAPTEVLVFDFFAHRSIVDAHKPTLRVFSALPAELEGFFVQGGRRNELPISEKVVELGRGPFDLTTPDVPRYSKMMDLVFSRTGFPQSDFLGFRFTLRYPPMPSQVIYQYKVADPPSTVG